VGRRALSRSSISHLRDASSTRRHFRQEGFVSDPPQRGKNRRGCVRPRYRSRGSASLPFVHVFVPAIDNDGFLDNV